MKLSRYSIELGEQYYYNSSSNSIIKVTKKIDEALKNNSLQLLTTEEVNTLHKNGFIVSKNYDELQILKFNHNRSKFAARNASFIIYPTMQCNFDCYYCFEKNKKSALDANKTALLSSAIIKFIKNNRLNKLSIRWSGGEPLLAWAHIAEILKNLNNSVLDCKIYNTLATNGYLLNDEIITKLKDFDFQEVVVTLDGPESIHDTSRTIKGNNTKTFQRIVHNIAKLSLYVPVIVRINIDKNNYNSVETLLKELAGHHLNHKDIKIFCKPVIPCWSCSPDKSMLNMEQFYELEKTYIKLCSEYGFVYALHPNFQSSLRCPYYQINSFMIDPDLKLYKCSLYIGEDEKSIGYISQDNSHFLLRDKESYIQAINTSPFDNEECVNCKVLPLCFGKCPILWEKADKAHDEGCIPEKTTIVSKIRNLYNL